MAIATEATKRHFLAEFSFVVGRLLKVTSIDFLRQRDWAIRVVRIVGQPLNERQQRRIFRALLYVGGGTVSWSHENLIRSSDAHISN